MTYLPVIAIALAVLGPVSMYLGIIVGIREDIAALRADNATFWRVLAKPLSDIIHSPTHKRRDELVDGLVADHLDVPELVEVRGLLEAMVNCAAAEKDTVNQLAGALLLALAETQIAERQRRRTP